MNRIKIGRRVYELGKIIQKKMSAQEWTEAKVYLRRDDRPHYIRVEDCFFYIVQATFDPKYKTYDLFYRPMSLIYVESSETTREDSDENRLSIRSVRDRTEL